MYAKARGREGWFFATAKTREMDAISRTRARASCEVRRRRRRMYKIHRDVCDERA